jgi:hypothetical protein
MIVEIKIKINDKEFGSHFEVMDNMSFRDKKEVTQFVIENMVDEMLHNEELEKELGKNG